MKPFLESVRGMDCDEIFEHIKKKYGQSDFSWDYIEYFIQTAERLDSHSIARHKEEIMDMLKKRKAEQLDYDGVNRLYNVLFPYLTEAEVTEVLVGILTVYRHHRDEGWASADYGLMTDMENFAFAIFSRYNVEDNIWALQEILKMHCMWLNGTETLEIENIYKVGMEEHINGWSDFWNRLETDKNITASISTAG